MESTNPQRSEIEARRVLRERSLVAMAILFVLTAGVYSAYWYVDTTLRSNRLPGTRVSSWFIVICLGVASASTGLILTTVLAPGSAWVDEAATPALWLHGLAWLAWTLWLRASLEKLSGGRLATSWLWAIVFGMLYLQRQINHLVSDRVLQPLVPRRGAESVDPLQG